MTATRVTWCTGRFRFAVAICGVDLKYPRKQKKMKMQLQIAEIKVCGGQIEKFHEKFSHNKLWRSRQPASQFLSGTGKFA